MAPRDRSTSFVNPVSGGRIGRTDEGVDISASPGATIVDPVPGQSQLAGRIAGWYKGQSLWVFRILSGPFSGRFWYEAEQVTPPPSGVVSQGQPIGRIAPSGTGTEFGWAADASGRTLAQATTGYKEGQVTPAGADFAARVRGAVGGVPSAGVPSYVPKQYVPLVQQAADQTGIPAPIVAAQAQVESNFDARSVSSAGAEGWLQFLPSTFKQYGKGDPFNPADETGAYINYMKHLLQVEGGSIRKALAAYNAGEANIAAGYGYADAILAKAGAPRTIMAGQALPYSGTRPDGSDTGAGVDQVFANYEAVRDTPRSAPNTFSGSPFTWWWQSFSGKYAAEQQGQGVGDAIAQGAGQGGGITPAPSPPASPPPSTSVAPGTAQKRPRPRGPVGKAISQGGQGGAKSAAWTAWFQKQFQAGYLFGKKHPNQLISMQSSAPYAEGDAAGIDASSPPTATIRIR